MSRLALAQGITEVEGEFIHTAKNAPAKDIYRNLGFRKVSAEGDKELWRLALDREIASPAFIKIQHKDIYEKNP